MDQQNTFFHSIYDIQYNKKGKQMKNQYWKRIEFFYHSVINDFFAPVYEDGNMKASIKLSRPEGGCQREKENQIGFASLDFNSGQPGNGILT